MKQEITKLIEQERDGAFGVGVLEDKIHTLFKDKIREIVEEVRIRANNLNHSSYKSEIALHKKYEYEFLQSILNKLKKIEE
jgi:uncharacterized protein YaaR (DUF327 family)